MGRTVSESAGDPEIRQIVEDARTALLALSCLVPAGGLRELDRVIEDMEEMISEDFEPYFSGNAAFHLLAICQRCGRCCLEEMEVALSDQDARRIAEFLGISRKSFLHRFSRPHTIAGPLVGSARLIRKEEGEACPFFDQELFGCRVHQVKPQVCRAAFYLSKMNLLTCKRESQFNRFSGCQADAQMHDRLAEVAGILGNDADLWADLSTISPPGISGQGLFQLLLRLKGMEIYFGADRVKPLVRRLRIARMPDDDELRPLARLYAASLIRREWQKEKNQTRQQRPRLDGGEK